MHEELYVSEKSKIRFVFFAVGLVLLPFSFIEFAVREGVASFSGRFCLPMLAFGLACLLTVLDRDGKKLKFFLFPYAALLVGEFLRFGTVTIFNRVIPFDVYIISAFFMLAAFGYTFILYFVVTGKLRSKIPLLSWSCLMLIAAILSMILRIVPFFAFEDVLDGRLCVGVSDFIAFLIFDLSGAALGIALRDDKVKEENRILREKRRQDRM